MELLKQLQNELNDAIALPNRDPNRDKKITECTEKLNKAFLEYQKQFYEL